MREEHLLDVLAQALGQEQAQAAVTAIVEEWGDSLQRIPSSKAKHRALGDRNKQIRALYRKNELDMRGIAERFGLSESQVRRILGD